MSYEPVRAVQRGLEVLRALNERNGATLEALHRATGLPKATLVRLLDTLVHAGYVSRPGAQGYHLTAKVRVLAQGFHEEGWVARIAGPIMAELCQEIIWPSDLATCHGDAMVICETNRSHSPLMVNRERIGYRIPMLPTALGRAYLAFCPAAEREEILRRLAGSGEREDRLARRPAAVRRILDETRRQGYGVRASGFVPSTSAIAVPVMASGRVPACLSMIFVPQSGETQEIIAGNLPKLQRAAADIAARFDPRPMAPS